MLGRVELGIQQGGHQGDAPAAEAPDGGRKADNPYGDLRGQPRPFSGGKDLGLLAAFGPDKQAVVFGQSLSFAEVHFAAVVQAGNHIDPALGQLRQGGVFAKGSVAQ